MIKYRVICDQSHGFDAWFASSTVFDDQVARGHVACPHCGSTDVTRGLMAPAVRTSRGRAAEPPVETAKPEAAASGPKAGPSPARSGDGSGKSPKDGAASVPARAEDPARMAKIAAFERALGEAMRTIRDHVLANGVDVGRAFPEEARKIHYREAEERGIYGEATPEETRELLEEGIEILPMPRLPEDGH